MSDVEWQYDKRNDHALPYRYIQIKSDDGWSRKRLRVEVIPGVDVLSLPTLPQWKKWGKHIMLDVGPDITDAAWWLAWCPVHDTTRDPEVATARISFKKGAWICEECNGNSRPRSFLSLDVMIAERADEAEE